MEKFIFDSIYKNFNPGSCNVSTNIYIFLLNFSETPAKIQHSQKAKTVFLEVEPEFWIVLNVALPHRIKTKADGVRDINYYSDKLHDNVLEAILQRTYDMFKIFTGRVSIVVVLLLSYS